MTGTSGPGLCLLLGLGMGSGREEGLPSCGASRHLAVVQGAQRASCGSETGCGLEVSEAGFRAQQSDGKLQKGRCPPRIPHPCQGLRSPCRLLCGESPEWPGSWWHARPGERSAPGPELLQGPGRGLLSRKVTPQISEWVRLAAPPPIPPRGCVSPGESAAVSQPRTAGGRQRGGESILPWSQGAAPRHRSPQSGLEHRSQRHRNPGGAGVS